MATMREIVTDEVLDSAYAWLCNRRKDHETGQALVGSEGGHIFVATTSNNTCETTLATL
jgi:hypothetical protein